MPLFDLFWTTLIIFGWVLWFMLLFRVYGDLFARNDIGGWAKTGWVVLTFVLPFLGVFIYLIAEGHKMADRDMEQLQAAQVQQDAYIKSVAGSSAADQIAQAKSLLDSGTITQAEFDAMKAKALA
jgi:hypothetical protein